MCNESKYINLGMIDDLENMSTLEKLSILRDEIAKANLKKTGKNNYSDYSYYDLGDFMPTTLNLCRQLKLVGICHLSDENPFLEIISVTNAEDKITFKSKSASAKIQGAQDIQNLGGEQTYNRRYLWIQALELTESDSVDQAPQVERIPPSESGKKVGSNEYIIYEEYKKTYKSKDPQYLKDVLALKYGKLSKNQIKAVEEKISHLEENPELQGEDSGAPIESAKFQEIMTNGTLAEVIEAFNMSDDAEQKKSFSMRITKLKRDAEE